MSRLLYLTGLANAGTRLTKAERGELATLRVEAKAQARRDRRAAAEAKRAHEMAVEEAKRDAKLAAAARQAIRETARKEAQALFEELGPRISRERAKDLINQNVRLKQEVERLNRHLEECRAALRSERGGV